MNSGSRWRQQLQLWLILGITGGVLAAGFLMLPRDEASKARLLNMLGTSNRGLLMAPPVAMEGLHLASSSGIPDDWNAWEPHWRVVVAARMPCDQQCQEGLYVTRQVHVRLGRNADRVERVLLAVGDTLGSDLEALIEREHPQLRTVLVPAAEFGQWPGATEMRWNGGEPRVFVVDPQGRAMLYFTPQHEGADLLRDLNHLLKYAAEP